MPAPTPLETRFLAELRAKLTAKMLTPCTPAAIGAAQDVCTAILADLAAERVALPGTAAHLFYNAAGHELIVELRPPH